MIDLIIEVFRQLLLSPAFEVEMNNIENDFRLGTALTVVDATGATFPLTIMAPMDLSPFRDVIHSEPPRRIGNNGGPFPLAYIYHFNSDYPPTKQEADIVYGKHKWGLTIYADGETPAYAESKAARYASAAKKLIERNQYVLGGLPRAHGASSLTEVSQIVPNQRGAQIVMGFHLICISNVFEYRSES